MTLVQGAPEPLSWVHMTGLPEVLRSQAEKWVHGLKTLFSGPSVPLVLVFQENRTECRHHLGSTSKGNDEIGYGCKKETLNSMWAEEG